MPNDKKLYFSIGGKNFEIEDLEHSINDDFIILHQSVLGLPAINLNKFKDKSFDFFNQHKDEWTSHDKYFNNFTIIWRMLLNQRKFIEAEEIWRMALDIALEWENQNSQRIHKGTPYYFWAVTCFLDGNIDKGFWLMNQAYLEDIKTHDTEEPETPAKFFLYFDALPKEQFFRSRLIEIKEFFTRKFIESYSKSRNRDFNYENFESNFLKNANINKEVKFHFNLNIFRLEKLFTYPKPLKYNTISSLFYLETIFDLCRVFEYLIIKPGKKLAESLKIFAKSYNSSTPMASLPSKDFHTDNFIGTLQKILTNSYKINNQDIDELEKDILVTYGFRNFGAHRIKEDEIIVEKFEEIIHRIINTILLAIELKTRRD